MNHGGEEELLYGLGRESLRPNNKNYKVGKMKFFLCRSSRGLKLHTQTPSKEIKQNLPQANVQEIVLQHLRGKLRLFLEEQPIQLLWISFNIYCLAVRGTPLIFLL